MDKSLLNEESLSLEDFVQKELRLETISTEGFMDFLSGIVNKFKSSVSSDNKIDRDNVVKSVIKYKPGMASHIRNLENRHLGSRTFIVPNGFKGNYIKMLDALTSAYLYMAEATEQNIAIMTVDIAKAINSPEVMLMPNSTTSVRNTIKNRESHEKMVRSFFTVEKNRSHEYILNAFKNTSEIEQSLDKIVLLNDNFNVTPMSRLKAGVDELSELLTSYVSILGGRGETLKNNRQLKEISESIYNLSLNIEFCGVLQAYALQSYQSYNTLMYNLSRIRI